MRALDDFDNAPFPAAATVDAGHGSQHLVVVKDLPHLARRQVQIVAAIVRHDKPEPVRVGADAALDEIHVGRQTVGGAPVTHDLAARDQVQQNRFQPGVGRRLVEAELIGQPAAGQGTVGRLEQFAHLCGGRRGVGVFGHVVQVLPI